MTISLPEGWGQRVDAQKFAQLVERISHERRPLWLPGDPGGGPDSFDIPFFVDQDLLGLLERLYGQSWQVVLRRIAAASAEGEHVFARAGQVLGGTLGIIAAMAIPVVGVVLLVWILSHLGGKGGNGGGFVAR